MKNSIFAMFTSLLALVFNDRVYSPVLGAYNNVNATTAAGLVADNADVREKIWIKRIIEGANRQYDHNPLADNFTGRVDQARPDTKKLKKAIVEITDTSRVAGNTINVPTIAGFGGPAVHGEGDRTGSEQKMKTGNFSVQIGRIWYGIGWTDVAQEETVIGGRLDQETNDALRTLLAKKKSDDHMMRLREVGLAASSRNLLLPSGVASTAALVSSNVVSTTLIARGGEKLPSMGALPMDTTSDSGGSMGECFTFFSTDKALVDLKTEPAYLAAIQNAGVRGDANKCFAGGFTMWDGHGIYRWINRDHGNQGPIGSPLLPRARLGAIATGGTLASPTGVDGGAGPFTVGSGYIIYGGGHTWESGITPTPKWFEFFLGAAYTYASGDTTAAEAVTTKYVQIINSNGTYGTFPYVSTDGNGILISGAALAVGDASKRVTSFEKGAKIVQANILGTPFAFSLYLGAQALACGYGSLKGGGARVGRRTERHENHGMDHAIGMETAWGNAVVKRAGDDMYPNFLLAAHAISEEGGATISA